MIAVNPKKGDVEFEAGGERYVLNYSHRTLVLLETKLDKGLFQIMREIDDWKNNPADMRLGTICTMIWAGLQRHHPDMTMDDAMDVVDQIDGGFLKAVDLLGESFQRGFNASGTKGTNPQKRAENGTGTISTSSTPVSDIHPTSSGT